MAGAYPPTPEDSGAGTISPLSSSCFMPKVIMYSTALCPFCVMAERLLLGKGIQDIEKIRVDLDTERRQEMLEKTRRRTVPQIFIGETHVGGFDDLARLDRTGELDRMLGSD